MEQHEATQTSHKYALNGRLVLLMLLAFFGSIFVVNGVFAYRALSTYTGEIAVEPYRKGLAYNDRIAAAERQERLGWEDTTTASRDGTISISITDRRGTAIHDLTIEAVLGRPATDQQDRALAVSDDGQGHYLAHTPPLDGGTWMLTLKARRAGASTEPVYQARRRLWLAP